MHTDLVTRREAMIGRANTEKQQSEGTLDVTFLSCTVITWPSECLERVQSLHQVVLLSTWIGKKEQTQ